MITGGNTKTNAICIAGSGADWNPTALASAESVTSLTFNALTTFANPSATWADWVEPWQFYGGNWVTWLQQNPQNQIILGIDLVPWSATGVTTAPVSNPLTWEQQGAAGDFNTYYTQLAQNLVSVGACPAGQPLVIRLGIEANGNWEADWVGTTTAEASAWAQTYANCVTAMRAVTGANFLFVWNVNAAYSVGISSLSAFYPGNSYVDIIGFDIYDADATNNLTVAQEGWSAFSSNGAPSVNSIVAFAAAQGKPIAIPEWGLTTTDDPAYVTGIGGLVNNNSCAFQSYFDDGDGALELSSTYPNSVTAYKTAFTGNASSPALTISTTSLSEAVEGTAYSKQLLAAGGTSPYTWSLYSGSLPSGLTLSSAGVISGTPTGTGTASFTVEATDSASNTATHALSLTVVAAAAPPLAVSTTSLANGIEGTAYSQTLAATGGTTPYTWSLSSGSLPASVSLSSSGVISGTPSATGTASFTVEVTDSSSPAQTATQALSIVVVASGASLAVSTASLPGGTVGAAYSQQLAATGGTAPYTWSVSSGVLPGGLSLASGGVLSGTPTTAGTSSFTVEATDSASHNATKALSVAIVAAPASPGAIVMDASAPNPVSDLSESGQPQAETPSFSPPANSLLVALVTCAFDGTAALSVSDSGSHTWVEKVSESSDVSTAAAVFETYLTTAPGSITVTAKGGTGMEGGALQLGLAVLDGAASSQTGAGTLATHGSSGESVTGTITTTETGSQVFLAAAVNHNPETFTPTGTTSTMWIYNDTTGGDEQILGQLTSPTGTPGATSVGWTDSASGDWSLVAVEILAAGVAEVDVPNVVGMTEAAATAAITAAGFVAAGPLVASQSPTAGTAAAPGSTVTITL